MMDYNINIDGQEILIETRSKHMTDEIVDMLVAYRKGMKFTQQDISEATGMKRANIARLECKKNEASLDSLVRYASCMGLKLRLSLEQG